MQQMMLVTGPIDYETFGDRRNENPIEQAQLFDISTPEKLKAAKLHVIRTFVKDYEDHHLLPKNPAPKEPFVTLSQAQDAQTMENILKNYETQQQQYREQAERDAEISNLLAATVEEAMNFPDDLVNWAFGVMNNVVYENEEVQRIYFYTI